MDVVHAWCTGAKFGEICKMTDVFEGSIIRAMRRLEELLREMSLAAKAIGNSELENKFAEGTSHLSHMLRAQHIDVMQASRGSSATLYLRPACTSEPPTVALCSASISSKYGPIYQ